MCPNNKLIQFFNNNKKIKGYEKAEKERKFIHSFIHSFILLIIAVLFSTAVYSQETYDITPTELQATSEGYIQNFGDDITAGVANVLNGWTYPSGNFSINNNSYAYGGSGAGLSITVTSTTEWTYFISPMITENIEALKINLQARAGTNDNTSSTDKNDIQIYITNQPNNSSLYKQIFSKTMTPSSGWTNIEQTLNVPSTSISGQNNYIIIGVKRNAAGGANRVGLDDIKISYIPPFDLSANTTPTSATLSWNNNAVNPLSYNLQYALNSATDWTGATQITNANTTTISSLTPATEYKWRIQQVFADVTTSTWVEGGTFTTKSYTNTFEPAGVNNLWSNAANWSNGNPPNENEYVIIPAGEKVDARSTTIEYSTLTLKDDATSKAELLFNNSTTFPNSTANATVEAAFKGYSNYAAESQNSAGWYLFGVPITIYSGNESSIENITNGNSISNVFSPVSGEDDLYYWNNTTAVEEPNVGTWMNWFV
ncbi:MAG: fibronectin type III domain-containing protein, partial [Bacteroidales bacterium]|nr:fibronectin type III domain-containing protein [Bacteroidales bacterium]